MEYEFTCEIVEDCESYCEKLGHTSSLPIFIADDECSEIVNRIIDKKYIFEKKYSQKCIILYLDNKASYFVALAIGKRLNLEICSVSSYSKTQKGDEELLVLGVVNDDSSEKSLDYSITSFYNQNVSYLTADSYFHFSLLVFKYFTSPPITKTDSEDLFVNMLESKDTLRSNSNLTIATRKNSPYLSLIQEKKSVGMLLMALHGDGSKLYLGEYTLVSREEKPAENRIEIKSVLKTRSVSSLYLDSCMGLIYDQGENIYNSIIESSVNTLILYRGVKENNYPECFWYWVLRKWGKQSSEIVSIVNENLHSRTNDLPMYVCVGNDLSSCEVEEFSEYSFESFSGKEGKLKRLKDQKECSFGFIKIESQQETFDLFKLSFLYTKRIHWIVGKKYIWFWIEKGALPETISFTLQLRVKFEKVKAYFNALDQAFDMKKSWSKELRTEQLGLVNQFQNLSEKFSEASYFSDISEKMNNNLSKIFEKQIKLLKNVVIELIKKQNSIAPISELYYTRFFMFHWKREHLYHCPNCQRELIVKSWKSKTVYGSERIVGICQKCGEVFDYSFPDFTFSTLEITREGERLGIKLKKGYNPNKMYFYSVPNPKKEMRIGEFVDSEASIELERGQEIRMLKIFIISDGKLSVEYHLIN